MFNLLGLAVDAAVQRRGIGSELLKALEEQALACNLAGIRLNSGVEQVEAHRFYTQCGYHLVKG